MDLFKVKYNGQIIRLSIDDAAENTTLYIDDVAVLDSKLSKVDDSFSYLVDLHEIGESQFNFKMDITKHMVSVNILNQVGQVIYETKQKMIDPLDQQPQQLKQTKEPNKWLSAPLIGLILKFSKSIKVVKVTLLAASAGAYSILFSWQFALVLLAVIAFHEYGHVFAMKKSGLKTKGFYFLPFVGGMAVSERAKSNWQEVFISMMGPVFGLVMSVAFYIAFVVSQNHFIGLVATFSALINLFNLLPIYPLDGGHVLKAIVFSFKKYWGFLVLMAISALGFVLAMMAGWYFLCFFVAIGFLDLVFSWRRFAGQTMPALDKYGMLFSLVWYFATVAVFVGILALMINSGLPGTEVVSAILAS
ncbi:metalloprotease [Marinicellulosiphila megalodicopiae]|uniref:metalloprotease n=1 Tax=Marinicellulosiphila megalodicopiae TaxID=2724896 RepID=UPI003BB146D3